MLRMMTAASASGSGKTILTCALLSVLKQKGYRPCAFKCGPDYVDPRFHRSVPGVQSRNLDLFFYEEAALRRAFAEACAGFDAAITEGVMGFYDGLSGNTTTASSWHVADLLSMPVLIIADARQTPMQLSATLKGMCAFRGDSHIRGVLFNRCRPERFETLRRVTEEETGLPVFGFLPGMPEADVESRHLGLAGPLERSAWQERLQAVAETLVTHTDVDALCACFEADDTTVPEEEGTGGSGRNSAGKTDNAQITEPVRIAVARDAASTFYYPENDAAFREAGAEAVPFSLLHDNGLPPETSALYLPGGYPELYARELEENAAMRQAVCKAVRDGLPVVAEGGGFLYLLGAVTGTDGLRHGMAGLLEGEAANTGHLVRFGYAYLSPKADSLLFRKNERVPVHEFHYWDTERHGNDLILEKPDGTLSWETGFATETMYAGFPQICFAAQPELTKRFAEAAKRYRAESAGRINDGRTN